MSESDLNVKHESIFRSDLYVKHESIFRSDLNVKHESGSGSDLNVKEEAREPPNGGYLDSRLGSLQMAF